MRQRDFAAVVVAVALVAACNPQSAPPQAAVLELLGGPKSATDYSREITAREVTLATGEVRSWSLGVDFGARPLQLAPMSSQPPAAYLLGEYGVADLGIYTFPGSGPHRISGALAQRPGLMAPDQTVYSGDRQYLTRVGLDGVIVDRWPIPIPLPGNYPGPSGKSGPTGHTLFDVNLAIDSAGDPFVLATNGVNGVLADLTRGRQIDLPGLGFARSFQIRADGKAFALATSYALATNPGPCPICGPPHPSISGRAAFTAQDSLIEFDTQKLRLTARYAVSASGGQLLLGRQTIDVLLTGDTSSTLLTLDQRLGTFTEHGIPLSAWGLSAATNWAGNVYLVSHPYPQVLPASGARNPGFQDRLMFYDRTTGKVSDAAGPLRPPPNQEVLGLIFRN